MHLVLLLFALFASLFTLQKEALNYCEPFFLVGSRMSFAGILLLSYHFYKEKSLKVTAAAITPVILLGITNIYLTNIFEIWGLSNMASSKTCLIYSLSPFLASIVAYIVLNEKMCSKKWLGLIVGFCGMVPIFYTQTETEIAAGKFWIFTYAEMAVLMAVLFSVYGWIQLKNLVQNHSMSFIQANGISMLIGGLLALAHSYQAGEAWAPIPVSNFSQFAAYSLVMCLISNIICYNLYGYLLKHYSATFMSFSGLTTPLFASFFGWVFLHETITWHYFASTAIFGVGLYVFYLAEKPAKKEDTDNSIAEQPAA